LDKIQYVAPTKGLHILEEDPQLLPRAKSFGQYPVCERPERGLAHEKVGVDLKAGAKFNAAYDKIKKRNVIFLGVADMMTQSLRLFKTANKPNNFNLVHCWRALKYFPKWHGLYASYDADNPGESNVIDVMLRL
jgi:hypothetical protein